VINAADARVFTVWATQRKRSFPLGHISVSVERKSEDTFFQPKFKKMAVLIEEGLTCPAYYQTAVGRGSELPMTAL